MQGCKHEVSIALDLNTLAAKESCCILIHNFTHVSRQ
jgi:hypothetical protein